MFSEMSGNLFLFWHIFFFILILSANRRIFFYSFMVLCHVPSASSFSFSYSVKLNHFFSISSSFSLSLNLFASGRLIHDAHCIALQFAIHSNEIATCNKLAIYDLLCHATNNNTNNTKPIILPV